MQSSTHRRDNSYISLGERRGKSDLARFSLDLSWARAASDSARARAYPSPPMSGSPPLPPRRNLDSSDRGHGSYGSTGQDILRGAQASQAEQSGRNRGLAGQAFAELLPPASYAPYRQEDMAQPLQYQQRSQIPLPQHQQQQHAYSPQGPPPFSRPDRSAIGDAPEYSSPKTQRKTKGHVASACVPCKRAHLRCDAQRPCSRCLSNGKEDTCVDVQHKKRGRPRLRDEREPRYEGMGPNYPPQPDTSLRRPLSLYADAPMSAIGESLQRSSSYRVLKSQGGGMGGPIAPRYLEHALPADAGIYGASIPRTPRMLAPQEPICAYLNMEMQIAKATQGFEETVGITSVVSRKLHDIVSASDRDKIFRLQRLFEDERREREPNYLPPIYPKLEEDRVIQSVGFGTEDITPPFRTDRQEIVTFQGADGQLRTVQVRFGLAKRESTYFVVLGLNVLATSQAYHQASSPAYSRDPYSRDSQYGFPPSQQQVYQQNTGASPFMLNPAFGDPRGEMATYRTPGPLGPTIPPSANMSSFTQPPTRPDFTPAPNPYQTSRNELPSTPSQQHPQRQHDLQLPPIRDQRGEGSSADPMRRRDDRGDRLDIGGLLEKSDRGGSGR